jgi:hypothetical protein
MLTLVNENGGRPHFRRLVELSRQAISYAVELRASRGTSNLWERLYCFNRVPDQTHADSLTPSDEPGEAFVAPLLEQLGSDWAWTQRTDPQWIFFSRPRLCQAAHSARRRNGKYKVYVSPAVGTFRRAVGASLGASKDCATLKFARTHDGTLRPDKIVIYTNSFAHTRKVATSVLFEVGDIGAHGVPFTAELGGDGLLSWAMDPTSIELRRFSSWRVWISQMLVRCIVATPAETDPDVQVDAVLSMLATRYGVLSGDWTLEAVRRKRF